jgi:polyferredoxin
MEKERPRLLNAGRRLTQALSLLCFLFLLRLAESPDMLHPPLRPPPDLYLRLDPLAALALPPAARAFIPALLPGLGVLLAASALGRVFCGWFCPFGVTLDLARFLGKGRRPVHAPRRDERPAPLRQGKYLLLAAVLGAAAIGVNAVFLASPIPLITRFYTAFIYPAVNFAGKEGLDLLRPLLTEFGSPLAYAQPRIRHFDALFFILIFFGTLFILERFRPRFWCRYLCPAGALLGLFARKALWRRRVTRCVGCGRCRLHCPTGAIDATGTNTAHQECIACRRCEAACPGETRFSFRSAPRLLPPQALPALPERRRFLQAGLAGMGGALGALMDPDSPRHPAGKPAHAYQAALIRPPGAVPEEEFLRRCLRCGACMHVCPSNALQPVYFLAGAAGLFSPVLMPRRGACEADCNACGPVCPSRALRALPLEEKQKAKTGTAVVLRDGCLAWEHGKRCVVCQEVCPYGAIALRPVPGREASSPPAPEVKAERCFGCGACEHHCPVASPAVVVEAAGALRLAEGSYVAAAGEAGLMLELTPKDAKNVLPGGEEAPEGALPPGFTE